MSRKKWQKDHGSSESANPRHPATDLTEELNRLRQENEKLHRAVAELSALNDLAQAIGGSQDSQTIIQHIISRARQTVDAEQATVHVINPSQEEESKTLFRTMGKRSVSEQLHLNVMLEGWMLLHKKPLLSNDPHQDPRLAGAVFPDRVRNLLAVPLMSHSRVIGILMTSDKRGDAGFDADDERVLGIIGAQSAQVMENTRLAEEEKALKVMQEQMHLARQIQINLLPDEAPVVDGYELAGYSLPALEVGGDYYDFVPMDNARLAICVGDVSGKGLPASMLMANLQATLRSLALFNTSVDFCLERANNLMHGSTPPEKFVTLFYAVLNPQDHNLSFANAGHEHPLLWRAASARVERLEQSGLILGAFSGSRYSQNSLHLEPGDILVIYSDGVTDADNLQEEPFGEERLCALLEKESAGTAGQITDVIWRTVKAHVQEAPQLDDITLLVVKRSAD
jgi:sigma-B regulation protein RsbU (phosphoserine phosphatase)